MGLNWDAGGRHCRIRLAVPAADKQFRVIIAAASVPSPPPCSNSSYPDPSSGASVQSVRLSRGLALAAAERGAPWAALLPQQLPMPLAAKW